MKRKITFLYLGLLHLVVFFSINSCSITKHVPENEFLLEKNKLIFEKDSTQLFVKKTNIDEDDILAILKQKTNRKTLGGIRFYLRLYNFSNENRIKRKRIKKQNKALNKNLKIDRRNAKRKNKIDLKNKTLAEKHKGEKYTPHTFIQKQHVEPKLTLGERIRNSGEAPIIVDALKTKKSEKQLNIYLINKGYFNNSVISSTTYFPDTIINKKEKKVIKHKRKHNRAEINYKIKLGTPYQINEFKYVANDSVLLTYIYSIKNKSLLHKNDIYDSDKLNAERTRIAHTLTNNGYKFFNKEFIHFKIDSNLNNHKINIALHIQNYKEKDPVYDTIIVRKHAQYNVMKIEVFPDYTMKAHDLDYIDTITNKDFLNIISRKKQLFKPKLLYKAIRFHEGELYSKEKTIATYKTLASLGVFKSTSISFDTLENGCNDLIARIKLQPAKMQSFTVATDGTHTDGLLGIEGRISYSHKNIFKGAEKLQISLNGGLEMQRLLTDDDLQEGVIGAANLSNTFNTIEFGPRISLLFPRFLFLGKFLKKAYNPKTELTGILNYQRRPDFTRSKENFSFGYVWHEKSPITYRFTPVNISAIKIDKSKAFEDKIALLNDRLLAASYQDHIIASTKLSFTYNGQEAKRKYKNIFYFQSTLETAGNSLRAFSKATNQPLNNQNAYEFLGIRFAQFAKISGDFRYYNVITPRIKLVSRIAGGVGVPLKNLNEALPFEKSFYSGGANGLRAWKARTMGPGAYYDSTKSFDKIGDIHLEANIELRFPLSSWIEGAIFADAGNIWLINNDSLRVGGEFKTESFVSEIGLGAGLGIRMDLDFFIIRFDFAMPIRNPALPEEERWIGYGKWKDESSYGDGSFRNDFFPWQFNLGIGYPF